MRRRITKKRRRIGLIIFVVLLALIVVEFNFGRIRLLAKGYSFTEASEILALSDDEEKQAILDADETLPLSRFDSQENDAHYTAYTALTESGLSDEEIVSYVDGAYQLYDSDLSDNGYTWEEFVTLLTYCLDDQELSIICDEEWTLDAITPYLSIYGCIVEDMEAYLSSELDPLDAVMQISYACLLSSNRTDESRDYLIEDPTDSSVVVKNGFYLPDGYEPDDLVALSLPTSDGQTAYLQSKAAEALEAMADAAEEEGYYLGIASAYRSYEDQQEIYDAYFSIYDEVTAAGLVSLPGCSEHQTGLGVDLTAVSIIEGSGGTFYDTEEYDWVREHAAEYGFILRYSEEKSDVTGVSNEPWHYRYVGVDLATELAESGQSLEEYVYEHGFSYPVGKK